MAAGVRVTGLREAVTALKRAGASTDDLKEAWQPIGREAVQKSRQVAPKRTGRLAGNIRSSRRQNGVVVSVGGARAPYASYVYYGSVHNPRPVRFIEVAITAMDLEEDVARAVNVILARLGF